MNSIFATGKHALDRAQGVWERGARRRRAERIQQILEQPDPPRFYDTEEVFAELQSRYPPRADYGWDAYGNWWRGIQRAPALLRLSSLVEPGARVLEVACGDGMTGHVVASFGHRVTLHDLEDWRDMRAKDLPFVAADLSDSLPLDDESFDLIFSYNAFEHIPDPAVALAELVRLCRRGGTLYIDFGPLFASPWGLHAWTALRMPYPQFLFSPEFYQRKIDELGLYDLGQRTTTLQPLNRWRLHQFEQAWRDSGCEIVSNHPKPDAEHLDVIERFPQAFTGRDLTYEDVVVDQVSVVLRKP